MKAEIKKRIEIKTLELIKQQGLKSVNMDYIARKAGISKKTMYMHYNNKEEVIYAVIQDIVDENRRYIRAIMARPGDAVNKMARIYRHVLLQVRDYHPGSQFTIDKYYTRVAALINDYRKWIVEEAISSLMHEARYEKLIRPDINISLSCTIQYSLLTELLNGEFNEQLLHSFNAFFDHYILNYLRGLLTHEAYGTISENFAQEQV